MGGLRYAGHTRDTGLPDCSSQRIAAIRRRGWSPKRAPLSPAAGAASAQRRGSSSARGNGCLVTGAQSAGRPSVNSKGERFRTQVRSKRLRTPSAELGTPGLLLGHRSSGTRNVELSARCSKLPRLSFRASTPERRAPESEPGVPFARLSILRARTFERRPSRVEGAIAPVRPKASPGVRFRSRFA